MMRKIIALLLVALLCVGCAVTASAEAKAIDFVVDEWDVLTDSELEQLNDLAADIFAKTGVGIFFIFSNDEDIEELDPSQWAGDLKDYYIMIENEDYWWSFFSGKGAVIDEDVELVLRDIYDWEDSFDTGIEAYLQAAAEYFPVVENPQTDAPETGEYVLFDEADLLSSEEKAELTEKLLTVSHQYNAEITVATIASMDGGDIDQFVEFAYDEMALGYGENYDGVLLLVCMDPREYRILSNGFAGVAIDTGDIDRIGDAIVSDLSDGNYAAAFDTYADKCAYYLDGYINGFPFAFGKNIVIALVIGLIAGLIVASVLKGQLKTVRKQDEANVYVKSGSMQVTTQRDLFLYRDVSRTKKESSKSSSSGSSRSTGGGSF